METSDTIEALSDIIAIGNGRHVVIDDCVGLDPYRAALASLADAGLIEMQAAAAGGILVTLTEAGRLAGGLAPSPIVVQPEPVQAKAPRPSRFITERNPVWLEYVKDFRRSHGRAPMARELRQRFPEMGRSSAYNYTRLGGPSLRLVKFG